MPRPHAPTQGDVFGGASRARYYGRNEKPQGYAHLPGTGPVGETCGTCAHCRSRTFYGGTKKQRRFYKCGLMVNAWTQGRASDICARSPACSSHTPGTPRETGIVR